LSGSGGDAQNPRPMSRRPACTVSAAFAQERDAGYAVSLLTSAADIAARFERRSILSERGEVQMVILDVLFADPAQTSRVVSCLTGAHGVQLRPQVDEAAEAWAS
jgi:hypothetical protein